MYTQISPTELHVKKKNNESMNSTREFILLPHRVREHSNKILKNKDFKLSKSIKWKLRIVFFMNYE